VCQKSRVCLREYVLITKYIVQPILKAKNRTAHAPCHVTWGRESEITTHLESPTPICLFTVQLLGSSGDVYL